MLFGYTVLCFSLCEIHRSSRSTLFIEWSLETSGPYDIICILTIPNCSNIIRTCSGLLDSLHIARWQRLIFGLYRSTKASITSKRLLASWRQSHLFSWKIFAYWQRCVGLSHHVCFLKSYLLKLYILMEVISVGRLTSALGSVRTTPQTTRNGCK